METTALKIDGMSCGHCVSQVTSALKKVPGVEVLGVEVGSASVRFDPNHTSVKAVAEAVTSAGYPAAPSGSAQATPAACHTGCCQTK